MDNPEMTVSEEAADATLEGEDVILEMRDTSVTFDMERGESKVLDDIDIDIKREEILGIVGESGSGKSMFASALLDAIVRPGILTGEITYYPNDGESVNLIGLSDEEIKQLRWEEISMVFQGAMSSFNPTMDIRGHFVETIKTHGFNLSDRMNHARELLSELYLNPERVLDSYPHELSGGMQQRALIALSLVLNPSVLVMDEPTAALDLLMQRSILNLIENLQNRYNLTVVFITHDLPLVAGLADRLGVLYAFQFAEVGPADRILEEAAHPYTRALLKAVPNLDLPLSEMRPIEGSSPDPVNVPQGCSYHPRCPLSDETCQENDPEFAYIGEDHLTACFHWEEARDEIPLSIVNQGSQATVTEIEGEQSEEPVVSLHNVDVHFEQGGGFFNLFDEPEVVRAVDNQTIDIYENDVVALVGESGCGKTTLGKAAVGGQRPTSGSVEYRGQDIWNAKDHRGNIEIPYRRIRRSLQIIHQDPGGALNPNRTVQASLSDPLKRWYPGLSQEERRGRILGMLETAGMGPPEDYASRYPHQLSGGEKQRVVLIRALLMNPDLILADEAVSALDVSLRVEMMDLMLDLQDMFDTSYLFISHNLSNARYFAGKVGGRIGVMYLGEIVEIGPAQQIINDPQHPYTKVLMWATPDIEPGSDSGEAPIRGIDIPDPVNPPSGCRFHTRCPEAREICSIESPTLEEGGGDIHPIACFRSYSDDHPYWESPSIEDTGSRDETTELADE